MRRRWSSTWYGRAIIAASLVAACTQRHELLPFAADSAAAAPIAQHLLDAYTRPDTEEPGTFDQVRRLAVAGAGETRDYAPMDWCVYYFALSDGTFCVREHYGEASQIRRVRQEAATWTDSLVRDAIGPSRSPQPGLLLRESYRGSGVACLTFDLSRITSDSAHLRLDSLWNRRGPTIASGIRCRDHGRPILGTPFLNDTAIFSRFWDRLTQSGHTFWIFETEYDGCTWLDVFLQRKDSVRSIASRPIGCD